MRTRNIAILFFVLLAPRSLEAQTDGSSTAWPLSFNSVESKQQTREEIDATLTWIVSSDASVDVMSAYGFYLGQQATASAMGAQQPSQAAQLQLAQGRFESKFAPAITNLGSFFRQSGLADAINGKIEESRLILSRRSYLESDAKAFVTEIGRRTKGEIPSPTIESLLMCHPVYLARPAQEYDDGFRKEFSTDGAGKSLGLKLSIEYPASWKSDDGRRPHVVKVLRSFNGHGGSTVMITANPVPAELSDTDIDSLSSADYGQSIVQELRSQTGSDLRLTSFGRVLLAGRPALWAELTGTMDRVGTIVPTCVINFVVRFERIIVTIQCITAPDVAGDTLQAVYSRNGPVFRRVVGSFDIYNRWDK